MPIPGSYLLVEGHRLQRFPGVPKTKSSILLTIRIHQIRWRVTGLPTTLDAFNAIPRRCVEVSRKQQLSTSIEKYFQHTNYYTYIYNQHQSSRNCVVSRKTCFICKLIHSFLLNSTISQFFLPPNRPLVRKLDIMDCSNVYPCPLPPIPGPWQSFCSRFYSWEYGPFVYLTINLHLPAGV
jgi:hypothetical protein